MLCGLLALVVVLAQRDVGRPVALLQLVYEPRSGLSTPFISSVRSLLELADACDVPSRWSCRTGVCHTCITRLLSGEITYSPDPLEPPPGDQILICCAQPDTDVVLDM